MDRFREATRQSWDKNTRFHVDIREKVFSREAWRRRFARNRAAPIKPPREGAARGERDRAHGKLEEFAAMLGDPATRSVIHMEGSASE